MGTIASQITSLTLVYSTVYSDADQREHQSSVSLAFVWGIHRGPVNSPHKWPVTRKTFPFDDVIMIPVDIYDSVVNWIPSQYKDGFSKYGDFHYKDQTVVMPSYLSNCDSYTGKTISLYQNGLLRWCFNHRPFDCLFNGIQQHLTAKLKTKPHITGSLWGEQCRYVSSEYASHNMHWDTHDDVIKNGNIFCVTGPLRAESTGHSPYKGHWRGVLMFSLICAWTNGWARFETISRS